MPDRQTLQRVRRDRKQGKAPSTQAGEFIREEFKHIRAGKHGARSPQQAIAIGLSKARRAGVELKPPAPGEASSSTRRKAERDYARGHGKAPARRAATMRALKRESRAAASKQAIAAPTHRAATRRRQSQRSTAAKRAAQAKGSRGRRAAARKAAQTRAAHTGA